MNALLLVHFIQKISSYSTHFAGTSQSQCCLEEYDIDVSCAALQSPHPYLHAERRARHSNIRGSSLQFRTGNFPSPLMSGNPTSRLQTVV